jgi:amino acid transporter
VAEKSSPRLRAVGNEDEVAGSRLTPSASVTRNLSIEYPENARYRIKRFLLGKPLVTEQLSSERLSRPIALGVLAPDCISSSAYGTEEMLTQMTPYIGLAAFSLLVPITFVILGVLVFVTASYLDVIGFYTSSGGSYVVTRDNFGPKVAQIAAVALLIDYTVTVAVQCVAGTDYLLSAVPQWNTPDNAVLITVGIVLVLIFGNLRGIREAGKMFALPTYFYVFALGGALIFGYVKEAMGTLAVLPQPPVKVLVGGTLGHAGSGPLFGLAFIFLLRAYANGGSSLTGLEAISNGVASFRRPTGRNARITLVVMSSTLGFLVLSTTLMARWTHALPRASGVPTVVSLEVKDILGPSPLGHALYLIVTIATMTILFTGGNTSFNGFPFLANYIATDRYLPRQLTKRGHRLAFSNGIIVLGVVALALVLVFWASLNGLVSLYAIGVFTGFTMAGLGMFVHHKRGDGPHRLRGMVINLTSAIVSFAVVLIFAIAKFEEGAWVVVVLGPLMYLGLLRLHRQYSTEDEALRAGTQAAVAGASALRRNLVYVLVDSYDLAAARAVQYARSLNPTELRAIHFDIDPLVTHELEATWSEVGPRNLALEVIECPDRRIERAALELAVEAARPEDTECTIVLPRRSFSTRLERLLHDRTADDIAEAVTLVPRVSATVIPFRLDLKKRRRVRAANEAARAQQRTDPPLFRADVMLKERSEGTKPVSDAVWRERARFSGRIRSISMRKLEGAPMLECTLSDGSGTMLLVFQGRSHIPGIERGARVVVEGTVGSWQRRMAIINPDYELVAGPESNL